MILLKANHDCINTTIAGHPISRMEPTFVAFDKHDLEELCKLNSVTLMHYMNHLRREVRRDRNG